MDVPQRMMLAASMRPPQKAGGNQRSTAIEEGELGASMRPPQKAEGNFAEGFDCLPDLAASMRPPQKAGGNSTWPMIAGFNEAPAKSGGE